MPHKGKEQTKPAVVLVDGTLLAHGDTPIEEPAILIDPDGPGTLLSWGEKNHVQARFVALAPVYKTIKGDETGLRLIELGSLSREEQCYVIRRCVEYTASGFHAAICKALESGDAREWLHAEMERVPIKVTE